MRLTHTLLIASMGLLSVNAMAATNAQKCLTYAKGEMKDNIEFMNLLNQIVINNDDVQEYKYDKNVGKQHIATEIVINAHSSQEILGKIVCLLEKDKPLYSLFIPLD